MSNKNDVIACVAMNNLHKMWPCQFDIEVPEAPEGWCWTVAWNNDHFDMILARQSDGDIRDQSVIEVITKDSVAHMASVLKSNIGCLGVQ
ncbi:hypothetical protein [Aeromonas sp. 601019]|uniref:hypothetical protein n=1 Tax=Aeromonas sp. 601019 TaxID=2712035 RepID=UPI003BA30E07